MPYKVEYTNAARRQMAKLDPSARRQVAADIEVLKDDPRGPGTKKLKGSSDWRLRSGDYRVIYRIEDDHLVVTVIAVGHRRDIYE